MDGLAMLGGRIFFGVYDEAEASAFCWAGQVGSKAGGSESRVHQGGADRSVVLRTTRQPFCKRKAKQIEGCGGTCGERWQ